MVSKGYGKRVRFVARQRWSSRGGRANLPLLGGRIRYTTIVEIESLYEMVASAARNAERMCSQDGGGASGGLPFQSYAGYPFYIDEHNRFVLLAADLDPEVAQTFQGVNLGKDRNPADVIRPMWKAYAELAAVRLNGLASYLKTKLGTKIEEHAQIIDLIDRTLRASLYVDPTHEREVQNALDTIFRARALDFRREQDGVPYSTKTYKPDFTFERIGLAVEVKLCKTTDRVKEVIDEINADIVGYGGRYERILFVIYDLGFIRDQDQFKADIEANSQVNVRVQIIKSKQKVTTRQDSIECLLLRDLASTGSISLTA